MPKPITIIIAGALSFAAILVVVVIVSSVIARNPYMPPDRASLPPQGLTPAEITVTANPHAHGAREMDTAEDSTKNDPAEGAELSGEVVVESGEPILAVEGEGWPPEGQPCGQKSGDGRQTGRGEIAETDAVRIILDSDEAGLIEPRIDSTKRWFSGP